MHLADINGFTNRVGNAFVSVTKIRERYKMRRILAVFCNRENFEYDTHALVQSFYPERHVKVLLPERWKEQGVSADIVITIADGQAEMKFAMSEDTQEAADDAESAGGESRAEDGTESIHGEYRAESDADSAGIEDRGSDDIESGRIGLTLKVREYMTPLPADKGGAKAVWKRFLYETLCAETGRTLPWGNLTGIRPTKLAMELLEQGASEEDVLLFLQKEHYVSENKAALCLDIAQREKAILAQLDQTDGYSLYIGIPFCPTTCLYCSFTSYPVSVWEKRMDDYLDCLVKEIDYVKEAFRGKAPETVYIGGGTPTSLSPERLERLLSKLEKTFALEDVKEFTVEAGRADSITREKLRVIRRHCVTRISVNPQTMKDETLRIIGRRHTAAQVKDAFHMAREEGFDNINMDLILGLPGEDAEDVRRTIGEVKALLPDSLTVHSLALKRASKLGNWIEENGIDMLSNTDETMEIAAAGAAEMGMQPYYLYRQKNMSGNFENTGYALPGKNGIYNILIMEEKQTIVALGAGSITKRVYPDGRIERCENVKDVALYMEKIDEMIERKRRLFGEV